MVWMNLGANDVWGDGYASRGLHLQVSHGGDFGIEDLHEWDALSLVPSAHQIQCDGGEDGTNCVDHTFQHSQEHGSSTSTLTMDNFDSVAIMFQTFRLV
jgi:hypothetical protein